MGYARKNRPKRLRACLAALLICIPAAALSQPAFQFSGYVLDLPAWQHTNETLSALGGFDRNQFFNLTRARLRPVVMPWSDAEISVEYEVTGLYRTSAFGTVADLSNPQNQLVDLTWTLIDEPHYIARHFIDRLFYKQLFDIGEFAVGRQRIAMGTGRVWNPTDLFNPINPANFAKVEKDGVDAATARLYLGELSDLTVVYNPFDDFDRQNIGAKVRTNFGEYDLSAMYGRFDRRTIVGLDFAGNLFDAGVRGEAIYSIHSDGTERFVKFILGIDNQFTPDFYGLAEYHYNGEGKTDRGEYETGRLLTGSILNLSTQYLALSLSYLIHPLVTGGVTSIANLVDGSGFVMATGVYSVSGEVSLTIGAQLTYGESLTEYWYYPTSVYGQIEWHF